MPRLSLRRYDHQAILSVTISALSFLPLLALVWLVFRNMHWDEKIIYYASMTYRLAILGDTAFTLLMGAVGLGLGLNSVGQRRNDRQQLSWIGFFVGALVICLTLVLFILFWTRSEKVV